MTIRRRWGVGLTALMLTAGAPPVSAAQTTATLEERVRQLYASAAYEEALAVLGEAPDTVAQQYRVLCLLALGRQQEAKAALQTLVAAQPDFGESEDLPPRVLTMLTEVRQQVLPNVLRTMFASAREHYQKQEYDEARASFERVAEISSHPDLRTRSEIAEFGLLAGGYIDILDDAQAKQRAAVRPSAGVGSSSSPPATTVATQPVAIRQALPAWPSEAGSPDLARVGLLHLRIGAKGEVLSARMIRGMDPRYDVRLVAAARGWQYEPATLNGVPVESESSVEVRLSRPPQR
jgi:hypothetical protein